MSARPRTWMPFYVGDYMADTLHLTTLEHGAYLLMICHYWRTGPLPDDDSELAAIARMEPGSWKAIAKKMRRLFQASEGRLRHKRIDAELANASATVEKKRASANARWDRERCEKDANAHANACAPDLAKEAIRISPSPSPSPVEDTELRSAPKVAPTVQKSLWAEGLGIVQELTGKDRDKAATLMGGWRNSLGKNDEMLLDILRAAAKEMPGAPISWIVGAIKSRKAVQPAVSNDWNPF